jgi:hypothetical protein
MKLGTKAAPTPEQMFEHLVNDCEFLRIASGLPAIAIGIICKVSNGKRKHFSRGLGTKQVESDEKVDENSVFYIGSNKKFY